MYYLSALALGSIHIPHVSSAVSLEKMRNPCQPDVFTAIVLADVSRLAEIASQAFKAFQSFML
jgi:hypothetical protein